LANQNYHQAKQLGKQFSTQISGAHGSIQGLTIGGSGGSTNINWNTANIGSGLFAEQAQPHVKKYEVFEIEEDLLLLSVVWQRLRIEREKSINSIASGIGSITDKILFEKITNEDIVRTEKIRDYYSKKLTLWALNEVRLSSFREDMKKLIQSNGKIFQENTKPLAYRLPEFYDYDIMFDEMFAEHNPKTKQTNNNIVDKRKLSLVKTFFRKRRHSSTKEYWFSDENDNLNVINISYDNPLLKLFDLYTNDTFNIEGIFSRKIRDNREYFVVQKYSFN